MHSVQVKEAVGTTPSAGRQSFGRGLYLLAADPSTGRRGWRLDYKYKGRRKTLSLGVYPEVDEKTASDKAGTVRQQLADGLDPSKERRKKKPRTPAPIVVPTASSSGEGLESSDAAPPGSFKAVAQRWYASKQGDWNSSYAPKVLGRLENHLYPKLGRKQVSEISAADLLDACQHLAEQGKKDTARRVCKIAGRVLSFAVVEGWAERNFASEVLEQLPVYHARNFPAITSPKELATLLKKIDSYHGTYVVQCALKLAPMLLLRPGELRKALWEHIDLVNGIMIVPADHRKLDPEMRTNAEDHVVPLARQAIEILSGLYQLTGRTGMVFPGTGKVKPFMSDATMNRALQRLGYCTKEEVTSHGFRATARTMLEERLGWDKTYAELQLAHVVPDMNGSAYNRTEFEDNRVLMMQAWADYLDDLRADKVVYKETLRERFRSVAQTGLTGAAK